MSLKLGTARRGRRHGERSGPSLRRLFLTAGKSLGARTPRASGLLPWVRAALICPSRSVGIRVLRTVRAAERFPPIWPIAFRAWRKRLDRVDAEFMSAVGAASGSSLQISHRSRLCHRSIPCGLRVPTRGWLRVHRLRPPRAPRCLRCEVRNDLSRRRKRQFPSHPRFRLILLGEAPPSQGNGPRPESSWRCSTPSQRRSIHGVRTFTQEPVRRADPNHSTLAGRGRRASARTMG
jgi:hypothetical protein